jgi:hypothetical protein
VLGKLSWSNHALQRSKRETGRKTLLMKQKEEEG